MLLCRIEGYASEAMASTLIAAMETALKHCAKLSVFHDWEKMEDYASRARIELTGWVLRHLRVLDEVHILARSPFVALGVAAANVVLSNRIHVHRTRDAFEKALRTWSYTHPR
jgi:hypothetical protein